VLDETIPITVTALNLADQPICWKGIVPTTSIPDTSKVWGSTPIAGAPPTTTTVGTPTTMPTGPVCVGLPSFKNGFYDCNMNLGNRSRPEPGLLYRPEPGLHYPDDFHCNVECDNPVHFEPKKSHPAYQIRCSAPTWTDCWPPSAFCDKNPRVITSEMLKDEELCIGTDKIGCPVEHPEFSNGVYDCKCQIGTKWGTCPKHPHLVMHEDRTKCTAECNEGFLYNPLLGVQFYNTIWCDGEKGGKGDFKAHDHEHGIQLVVNTSVLSHVPPLCISNIEK